MVISNTEKAKHNAIALLIDYVTLTLCFSSS